MNRQILAVIRAMIETQKRKGSPALVNGGAAGCLFDRGDEITPRRKASKAKARPATPAMAHRTAVVR
jgi:hypothetical protein